MSTVHTRLHNAVPQEDGAGGGPAAGAAPAAASDVRFCAVDDPGCEACQ